jgi:hypothetical protein
MNIEKLIQDHLLLWPEVIDVSEKIHNANGTHRVNTLGDALDKVGFEMYINDQSPYHLDNMDEDDFFITEMIEESLHIILHTISKNAMIIKPRDISINDLIKMCIERSSENPEYCYLTPHFEEALSRIKIPDGSHT